MNISKNLLEKLREDNSHLRKLRFIELFFKGFGTVCRWGCGTFMIYLICTTIVTSSNAVLEAIKSVNTFKEFLYCIVTISSIIFGLFERKLRREKTDYMQERIRNLEEKHDSERTTSGISTTGDSKEEDRI